MDSDTLFSEGIIGLNLLITWINSSIKEVTIVYEERPSSLAQTKATKVIMMIERKTLFSPEQVTSLPTVAGNGRERVGEEVGWKQLIIRNVYRTQPFQPNGL